MKTLIEYNQIISEKKKFEKLSKRVVFSKQPIHKKYSYSPLIIAKIKSASDVEYYRDQKNYSHPLAKSIMLLSYSQLKYYDYDPLYTHK